MEPINQNCLALPNFEIADVHSPLFYLPQELIDAIFMQLNDMEIQNANLVSLFWNKETLVYAIRKEDVLIKSLKSWLNTNVDESYVNQKNTINVAIDQTIISTGANLMDVFDLTFDLREELITILMNLDTNDLSTLKTIFKKENNYIFFENLFNLIEIYKIIKIEKKMFNLVAPVRELALFRHYHKILEIIESTDDKDDYDYDSSKKNMMFYHMLNNMKMDKALEFAVMKMPTYFSDEEELQNASDPVFYSLSGKFLQTHQIEKSILVAQRICYFINSLPAFFDIMMHPKIQKSQSLEIGSTILNILETKIVYGWCWVNDILPSIDVLGKHNHYEIALKILKKLPEDINKMLSYAQNPIPPIIMGLIAKNRFDLATEFANTLQEGLIRCLWLKKITNARNI